MFKPHTCVQGLNVYGISFFAEWLDHQIFRTKVRVHKVQKDQDLSTYARRRAGWLTRQSLSVQYQSKTTLPPCSQRHGTERLTLRGRTIPFQPNTALFLKYFRKKAMPFFWISSRSCNPRQVLSMLFFLRWA